MEQAGSAVEIGALAIRLTYFSPEIGAREVRQGTVIRRVGDELTVEIEEDDPPTLKHVAAAIAQADAYLSAAVLLEQQWDQLLADRSSRDRRHTTRPIAMEGETPGLVLQGEHRWATRVPIGGEHPFSIVSIEMRSPLVIIVAVSAYLLGKYGNNLLTLAERISTAAIRVQRTRKEEVVKKEVLDQAHEALQEGRADALALRLLELGPPFPHLPGPNNIDFLDADAPENDDEALERL
jgi:hypothetical protein